MFWLWLTLGWVLASVATAAVYRRSVGASAAVPQQVRTFVLQLENELARSHPGVEFLELLPQRFACLLRVDGQETPVALHRLYADCQAQPDRFAELVARVCADVRNLALDQVEDLDFAAAAPLLLPQVRSAQWLEERGRFGDGGLVATPLNDQLVAVYVVDDASSMLFVCRAHLQRWRKSVADVHHLAVANLARLGAFDADAACARERPLVLQTGDGYDAARVLLLGKCSDLLVALPDRDTLWVGGAEGANLEQLMATTESIARSAAHPVSAQVYRLNEGRLEALPASR
jgi:uncharacterized protein YtpQ (UPF0354 family)